MTYIEIGYFFVSMDSMSHLLEIFFTYTAFNLSSYLSLVIGVKTVFKILEIHSMLRQVVTQEFFIM